MISSQDAFLPATTRAFHLDVKVVPVRLGIAVVEFLEFLRDWDSGLFRNERIGNAGLLCIPPDVVPTVGGGIV